MLPKGNSYDIVVYLKKKKEKKKKEKRKKNPFKQNLYENFIYFKRALK